MHSHDAIDMTPVPNLSDLDDGVVFVSLEVANRLGFVLLPFFARLLLEKSMNLQEKLVRLRKKVRSIC